LADDGGEEVQLAFDLDDRAVVLFTLGDLQQVIQ
jgi:hypothetical protein